MNWLQRHWALEGFYTREFTTAHSKVCPMIVVIDSVLLGTLEIRAFINDTQSLIFVCLFHSPSRLLFCNQFWCGLNFYLNEKYQNSLSKKKIQKYKQKNNWCLYFCSIFKHFVILIHFGFIVSFSLNAVTFLSLACVHESEPISSSLIMQIHFSVWKAFSVLFLSQSQSQQQREEVIWNADFWGFWAVLLVGAQKS